MSTVPTACSATTSAAPGRLGSWVEAGAELCRGGRTYRVLVNHRTCQVLELTSAEASLCDQLNTGESAAGTAAVAFTDQLRADGFLASDPPPLPRRGLRFSAATLDLRWAGAGRLIQATYNHGARHLLRPAAVAAQMLLALAGLAALAHALTSGQHFQLHVHPAQIPLVLGLSLAAVGVHELAHGLVVLHYRRTVDAAGIRLHLGTPAFYVESASAVLLTRRQRLLQAAAGVWAEWQLTSLAALGLWLGPPPSFAPLLHRFVILNAATIATNLLPFTGLDGSWLLADAARAPDLTRRARGALTRLLASHATRQPDSAADRALAGYAAVNGLAAATLLATAGFFWYQLFGDLAATLTRRGPAGWAILLVAAIVLARPAATAAAARLPAAHQTARDLHAAIIFRLQWRWRIPATAQLATAYPQLGRLNSAQLGILAGHLNRTRHHGQIPASLTGSYGVVCTGSTTAILSSHPLTLTQGTAWDPACQLHHATCRTTLIHIPAATVHQLTDAADEDEGEADRPPGAPGV